MRPLTINIRTSIDCFQDLNLRLKVGCVWSCVREILLLLHAVLACLCFNVLEHLVLAIQLLLVIGLILELLPLFEHEGNIQILGRGLIHCMKF